MMTLQEFANRVKEDIMDYMPPEYHDSEVTITPVLKNNGVEYIGISIMSDEIDMAPTLYLESYYEGFKKGAYMHEVVEVIAGEYVECMEANSKEMVMNGLDMRDFESVRDKVAYQLINRKANEQMLENVPHRQMEDLAAVYRIIITTEEAGASTVLVTNEIQNVWGITANDLQKAADQNASQLQPPVFMPMEKIMMELMGMGEPDDNLLEQEGVHKGDMMYVLTNQNRMYGAAAILDQDILEKIGQVLDSDYYILPSSIHETIIISKEETRSPERLGKMVREINAEHVDLEERLSNQVYEFNRGEKSFKQAVPSQPDREDHDR